MAGDVVNQLSQAVSEVGESVTSYTSELEQQDIVRQVVEQIKVWNGNETSRMQVQLYPEHLGRVEIQVMLKNGTMTAQITAETEMAKAAIESQLQMLKESFEEKSIQVDAVEVSVGTPDFRDEQQRQDSTENNQDSRTQRSKHRQSIFMDASEDEEDQDTNERLEAQGASVEFTA
jgi:flagellar hook-length control protein FliK